MKLGIDLGGTSVRIGQLVDGKLVDKATAVSPSKLNLADSILYLKEFIAPYVSEGTEGIGIGVPSVVDVKQGIVYHVTNIPAWQEVPLKAILEEAFHVPVFVNNDANCFAIGEQKYGEGKAFRNMLGVTLGTGVGAGVILDGRLYNGSNTGAGEIGCMRYLDHIYEHYCGSEFFTTYHQTTGKEAYERARRNDPEALKMWAEYGNHLGELVQAILYAYDPEGIVFGGSISGAFPFFSEGMYKNLSSFMFPTSLAKLQIRISTNPDIALLGAAGLVE